jgi:hypothetical protein
MTPAEMMSIALGAVVFLLVTVMAFLGDANG